MPSIGDITGRIVIQDAGSAPAIKFGENIDKVSKTIIAGMSRATLATETAARKIAADLEKVRLQMKPTDAAKGLIADLDNLNIKLREEITAVKGGPAAIDALNKKRYEQANALRVAAAQAQAGVSAESALGKSIASQFAAHDRLQRELHETSTARARAIALAEQEAERYNRLTQIITGLAIAFVAVAARATLQFLRDSVSEAIEAEKAFAQLRAGVESTGGAAGKSAEELSALADELSRLTGFDDELIAGGEAILLTFRRVRGEAFDQTMKLALDLSARFGKDIDSSVTMIAKALDMLMAGSAKGLSALSKAGVTFTDQQKKTMEQLVKTGQAAQAEKMFFKELELQFGGSAVAARDTMGGALQALGVAWSNLKEQIGSGGLLMTGVINNLIEVIDTMTDGFKLLQLGATIAFKGIINGLVEVDIFLRRVQLSVVELQAKLVKLSPLSSDQQKLQADIAVSKTRYNLEQVRAKLAERNRQIDADIAKQTMAILGVLPKVKSNYADIGEEIGKVKSKQQSWFDDLFANLARQEQALDLLRQGMPVEQIENLIEAAEALGKTNLLDPLVLKAGVIKTRIDEIATAFKLADEAKKKFAEAGDDLDDLISKQFSVFGSNDPEMQKLLAILREAKTLTDSIKTDEQKRLEIVGRAQQLYERGLITATDLQTILLANADQWNIELDETQIKFEEIYEKLSSIAEGIAFDLVSNWRRAWEENQSLTDATLDVAKDSFANWVQDIVSQWLSTWFRAMAAWLARWIATQRTAAAVSAASSGGGAGTSGGAGSLMGMGAQAYGAYSASGAGAGGAGGGMSANQLYGYALAAFALYVVYKGFIEDHKRKFARVEITDGKWDMTAWHGKKYMEGVQQAAEAIVKNLTKFLDDIDVTMTRLGNVIIESSKAGWNVSIPGSTGKLFASMEEAISYAQVLMAKYGEFADSVSVLVKGVITSTKAISIEQLAGELDWARMLETQNLEQAALDVSNAMDTAIANWKRAEEMFLSMYSVNLPAFEAAIDSIITKLGTDLINIYNNLAGIEEDPEKAWQRQKAAYNAQRLLVLAQLRLWELENAARIRNYNAQVKLLGGGGGSGGGGGRDGKGSGGGIIGLAFSMLQAASIVSGAAEVLDPALQALLDIQDLITRAINEIPPELTDSDYPGKKGNRGGGKNRREMREDIRDEIDTLEAEARGALHASFNELNSNISTFRDRAKEAKLPATELARGVELLTEAFRRSVRQQARDYAGLDTELTRRLREIRDFFGEVRELGQGATGISIAEATSLESQALAKLGADLSRTILDFAGLSDPMMAISTRAAELRQNVLDLAEAAGWSSEQIATALENIERGVEGQRLQGINSALGNLFNILKQANLYQQEALEFERESVLLQLQVIEAQLRFYNALTAQTQAMIDAAKNFVNSAEFGSSQFGGSNNGTVSDPIAVKVVQSGDAWAEFSAGVKELVEAWREGIEEFTESTKSLLTDESLTNLTQAQQLDFAKSELEALITAAKSGDLEALNKLDAARREYLSELRESEGGGFGYQKGFEWVMGQTADILASAKEGETALMTTEFKKLTEAWAKSVDKLSAEMTTTLYNTTAEVVNAIYNAIGGVPGMASGGIVMSGPRLVRIAEYVPEAIVPLDRLSTMVPFNSGHIDSMADAANGYRSQMAAGSATNRYGFMERDSLARLSAVEDSNRQIAKSLASIRDDMSAIRRSR